MDVLPKDPAILVSSVNMLLRDEEFDTLESLCYAFNREPGEVRNYLFSHGFVWSETQKQFRPIGFDDATATSMEVISHGRTDFLRDHEKFGDDPFTFPWV